MSSHGWPEESNAEQAESLIQSREWWKRRWTESQLRNDKLEAALRRYGGHAFMQCDATKVKTNALGFMIDERDPCTCGWDEAAKLLTASNTGGEHG